MIIHIKIINDDKLTTCLAYCNNEPISEYKYTSKKIVSALGQKLINATLINWSISDICFANKIYIDQDLDQFQIKYLESMFNLSTSLYEKIYKNKPAKIIFNKTTKKRTLKKSLDLKNYYEVMYSGGKDSLLSTFVLQESNLEYQTYTLSYDQDGKINKNHHADISDNILNYKLYSAVSIEGAIKKNGLPIFHHSDDIHTTFISPFTFKRDYYSNKIVVGLPWDALHSFKNDIPDLVPSETEQALLILEKFINSYVNSDIKFLSPIAGFHPYAVFDYLKNKLGLDKVLDIDSCWYSNQFNGKQCGCCQKCQKFKLQCLQLYGKEVFPHSPILNDHLPTSIFSSFYGSYLAQYFLDSAYTKYWTDKHVDRHLKHFINFYKNYNLKQFEAQNNDQVLELFKKFYLNSTTENKIKNYIATQIEYDYSSIPELMSNDLDFTFPFEKGFNWNRKNSLIQSMGQIDLYDSKKNMWFTYSINQNSNYHFKTPRNKLFEFWLESENFIEYIK
jgi:hypothetical protein